MRNEKKKGFYIILKRVIDLILSILALLILSPVLIIIALSIKLDSKGPVLFRQKRVGKDKSYFQIFKFRTMKIETPKNAPTHLLENPDEYITKVGRILRKTSLDELPQLLNILKGEMAFVGPRPALWNQYDLIEERESVGANDMLPGLTGWAQINGRDELDIQEKVRFDAEYVQNIGLGWDFKCIWGTIKVVLKRDGIVEGCSREIKK